MTKLKQVSFGSHKFLGSGVRNLFKYCQHYSRGGLPELIEEDIFKCIVSLTPQVTPQDERVLSIIDF